MVLLTKVPGVWLAQRTNYHVALDYVLGRLIDKILASVKFRTSSKFPLRNCSEV